MPHSQINFEYKCNQKQSALKTLNGKLFCESCQTSIHDLTQKNRTEIKEYIKQNGGSLCGQFFQDQIEDSPSVKSMVSFKLAAASVAAFFALSTTKISAQSKDGIKTEQHESSSDSKNNSEIVLVNGDSVCTVYTSDDFESTDSENKYYRKQYMVIGKRHFFVTNKFPFFISRKYHRGKMKYRM